MTPAKEPLRVVDVDEASFEREVIDESRRRPVVVDFWARWCGPCRTLGPVLERLAHEGEGAWCLARVDTDASPSLAVAYGIQSIPAVKAFREGRVVAELVGAPPEPELRAWLDEVLPGRTDALVNEGDALLAQNRLGEAEKCYRQALDLRHRFFGALRGLARIEAARGDPGGAQHWLHLTTVEDAERHRGDLARLRLELRAGRDADEGALRARLEAGPSDLAARLRLGCALATHGRFEEALATLLEVVRRDRGALRDQARDAMVDVFEVVGEGSEIADRYRSTLARELFV